MRVSTRGAYLNGLEAMQRLQQALDVTQRQIASGGRILNPSDDPIGSSRALEFRENLSRLEQFGRNATMISNRLSQEEAALAAVTNTLQRVRELALQANNATQGDESRALIAIEMREQLDNLVQLANQQDGSGNYLFSGNRTDSRPVTRSGFTYAYNGDQGQRFIQIGAGREIPDSDPGSRVFFRIRNGNGTFSAFPDPANAGTGVIADGSLVNPSIYDQDQYTVRFIDPGNYEVLDSGGSVVANGAYQSGASIAFRGVEFTLGGVPQAGDAFIVAPSRFQDVFTTIDDLAQAIDRTVTDDTSQAVLTNSINTGLLNIDQALGNILDVRTQVGSRLAAVENQVDSNGAIALTIQSALADIQDLDYAEAISRLSAEATALEAAQQTFIRTQQLSLFDYL